MRSAPKSSSAILQRRPAYAVNAPAVLCHRCFRFREIAETNSVELSKIRRNIATIDLNAVLFRIQAAGLPDQQKADIAIFAPKESSGTDSSLANDRRIEQDSKRRFDELSASRSDQIRTFDSQETILSVLPILPKDGRWQGWRARMRVDLHYEFFSITFILDQESDDPQAPDNDPAHVPKTSDDAEKYVKEWYDNVWADFFALFGPKTFDFEKQLTSFFECRGLALSAEKPQNKKPKDHSGHDDIIEPQRTEAATKKAIAKLLTWPNDHAELVRRVLRLPPRSQSGEPDANCVLCTALQGRAIYASSMKPADSRYEHEQYLLTHDQISRYQLGRLLQRFHVLDELRAAVLFDRLALFNASELIRSLGNDIDQRLHTEDKEQDKSSLTAGALNEIQGRLNELTAGARPDGHGKEDSGNGSKALGGLLYRINRSRYYASNFQRRMGDMLFGRIDGWEPYEIFMHRNLFPVADHIDGIGQRFENLAARVERLSAARNAEELVKVESEIAYIQRIGEIIGWTAFAYYLGQILDKFLPKGSESCLVCPGFDPCHIVHGHVGTALAFALALILFGFFKLRHKAQP